MLAFKLNIKENNPQFKKHIKLIIKTFNKTTTMVIINILTFFARETNKEKLYSKINFKFKKAIYIKKQRKVNLAVNKNISKSLKSTLS